MAAPLVVFSHGKESGPMGTKIRALMAIAQDLGMQVLSIDYREHPSGVRHSPDTIGEPERRVEQLLGAALPEHNALVLVGSSMGGYVATVASQTLRPAGLFLLAPAFDRPGYLHQHPEHGAELACVVHGWRDESITPTSSMRFAEQQHCDLNLIDGDHGLNDALPQIEPIFRNFLQCVLSRLSVAQPVPPVAPMPVRAWVRQPSGRHLDLINPETDGFDDMDLALGLARTFRWGGHSVWPRPLTVAQHCLTVLQIRIDAGDLPARVQLLELLHDAEEGLIGFDPISPLKPILGQPFQTMLGKLQRAVLDRYGAGDWSDDEYAQHKRADILAAASEAVHVAGWSRAEVREVLGIQMAPLDIDPLHAVYGGEPWDPWPVDVATQRFLEALRSIVRSC